MLYERLTKRGEDHLLHVFDINDHEIALSELKQIDIVMLVGRLAVLEDKIESGEIVDRNDYLNHLLTARSISELTDEEIEFFVKHNARIRKFVDEDITRLTAENAELKARLERVIELPKPDQTIIDLITEFDEMGFAPTTLHPDPEQYAIDWRDQVRKEFARLTAERDDYKSRAEAAEQEATSWRDCANKCQKYYKEEVVPLLEEMRNKQ